MSYLCGPMTREQIKRLDQAVPEVVAVEPVLENGQSENGQSENGQSENGQFKELANQDTPLTAANTEDADAAISSQASPLQTGMAEIDTYYLSAAGDGNGLVYQPAVVVSADINYLSKGYNIDEIQQLTLIAPIKQNTINWDTAVKTRLSPDNFETKPLAGAAFATLPKAAQKATTFERWEKAFLRHVRQQRALRLYKCATPKLVSDVGEEKSAFRVRLNQQQRELRDQAVAKLQQRYGKKLESAQNKLSRAEDAISRKQASAQRSQINSAISVGSTVLGAFMGRKMTGYRAVNTAGRAMRSVERIGRSRTDLQQAHEKATLIRDELAALETELRQELSALEATFQPRDFVIEDVTITPKTTNIAQHCYGLLWLPYRKNERGQLSSDW